MNHARMRGSVLAGKGLADRLADRLQSVKEYINSIKVPGEVVT